MAAGDFRWIQLLAASQRCLASPVIYRSVVRPWDPQGASRGHYTVFGSSPGHPGKPTKAPIIVSTKWPLFQRRDFDGVVKCCFSHFPSFYHSMLTTMVMCHHFMLEKHFYYTISMFLLIRVFMCREIATSCDFYRRRQVDVFVLKTVEACGEGRGGEGRGGEGRGGEGRGGEGRGGDGRVTG